ncbi:hypothetical protein Taro_043039 [Colocasia esculenta]|uniref:Uncharacterized protein n=1 Tax=Colocasia esculenta TaxID=4460 RepID=A0A843X3I6_COLES|nr:hypothetical protein [Colocasia esculenta]
MGYLYKAMDRAKELIQMNNKTTYAKWWEIIDRQWEHRLHHDFHVAGDLDGVLLLLEFETPLAPKRQKKTAGARVRRSKQHGTSIANLETIKEDNDGQGQGASEDSGYNPNFIPYRRNWLKKKTKMQEEWERQEKLRIELETMEQVLDTSSYTFTKGYYQGQGGYLAYPQYQMHRTTLEAEYMHNPQSLIRIHMTHIKRLIQPPLARLGSAQIGRSGIGISRSDWEMVFKLQNSIPRNDFCHIAAKNGILIRLVNTLHSLNEATRLAYVSGCGSLPASGSTQMSELDRMDSKHFMEDSDKRPSHPMLEASISAKFSESSVLEIGHVPNRISTGAKDWELPDLRKPDSYRAEVDGGRQQRSSYSATRSSTDKSPNKIELISNGQTSAINVLGTQHEPVRPLLSLLEKEPPSRHVSGQLEYVRHISGLERHESILPLLHSSTERKTNGELDFLMAEFAEVSRRGRENGNQDCNQKVSNKTANKKMPMASVISTTSNEGAASSSSGVASQTASGVLSGSGVLNARPGSATSSGLLLQMVSSSSADVAKEYLEKVADLLLEFSQADSAVKAYMCSQSLLARLFQMFNKIEPPILLKNK